MSYLPEDDGMICNNKRIVIIIDILKKFMIRKHLVYYKVKST